jgi:hypothetical protein
MEDYVIEPVLWNLPMGASRVYQAKYLSQQKIFVWEELFELNLASRIIFLMASSPPRKQVSSLAYSSILKMEAESSFETSVNFNATTSHLYLVSQDIGFAGVFIDLLLLMRNG